jgi:hypothetical protein
MIKPAFTVASVQLCYPLLDPNLKKLLPIFLSCVDPFGCKYTMRYHLVLDNGAIIPFNLLSCAEIYQRALGGVIYAVDISRPIDGCSDTITHSLESPSTLLATQHA